MGQRGRDIAGAVNNQPRERDWKNWEPQDQSKPMPHEEMSCTAHIHT
jgi:hypothetical protein